ncbi:MAG: hypothetical protein U9Q77_07925 [Candidatus Marinimicrobia bacterium]|nr:hypothetical protein [Candidatus Neomarinimicrobiota bacterium]
MRFRYFIPLLILILFNFCSKQSPEVQLSDPGFGVVETHIDVDKVVDLPVLIKFDQVIKGIQFTLTWDTAIVKVGQPELTELNSGFTVSTSKGTGGEMKVLVFSMTGDVLNTSEPEILSIPISVLDSLADQVSLLFDKAVFAGPNALSYDIPVTHANLTVRK